jgi:hypothetical protein
MARSIRAVPTADPRRHDVGSVVVVENARDIADVASEPANT